MLVFYHDWQLIIIYLVGMDICARGSLMLEKARLPEENPLVQAGDHRTLTNATTADPGCWTRVARSECIVYCTTWTSLLLIHVHHSNCHCFVWFIPDFLFHESEATNLYIFFTSVNISIEVLVSCFIKSEYYQSLIKFFIKYFTWSLLSKKCKQLSLLS